MNLIDIFNSWDEARLNRTSTFRLKKSKEISPKDSPYKIAVKQLTNYRIEHRLSLTDISEAIGISHETVAAIEEFRGSENWLYVYAMIVQNASVSRMPCYSLFYYWGFTENSSYA